MRLLSLTLKLVLRIFRAREMTDAPASIQQSEEMLTTIIKSTMILSAISMAGVSTIRVQQPADLIIWGGSIYTMETDLPQVEAVAVREGRIIFTGSVAEAMKLQGPECTLLNLDGQCVIPGLIDAHAHLLSLGRSLSQLNLVGTTSTEQIRQIVLDKQKNSATDSWITGRGWDQNDWDMKEFPSWQDLSGSEANPVYLRRVDGHAIWINKAALQLCGITADTPDPEGGKIIRDQKGNPTGVFVDNAINLIESRLPKPTTEDRLKWVTAAIKECHRYGLVGVHDAGVDSSDLELYEKLRSSGELSLRIYAMLSADDSSFLQSQYARGPIHDEQDQLTVRSIKLYADGALGSRGAYLLEPYTDDPGNRGLLVTQPEQLYQMTKMALEHGFGVCTHAIGDGANRVALDAYERALKASPTSDYRLRIEHCQVVALADIPRFAKLNIIPSMQPIHATSDMPWAEKRLGPQRIKGAYAWRSFLDQGCHIACGSDFPVESPNPLLGIYAAVTRQDLEGNPKGGWYPQERMTLTEAIRGFTLDATYAEFAENRLGSIKVGKWADFTILDKDIFKIEPAEIPHLKVTHTIVSGKTVYSASH